jgi:hypothetical protein
MVELIDTEIGDVTEAKDKNGKTGAYLAAFNGKDQVVNSRRQSILYYAIIIVSSSSNTK